MQYFFNTFDENNEKSLFLLFSEKLLEEIMWPYNFNCLCLLRMIIHFKFRRKLKTFELHILLDFQDKLEVVK